VASSLDGPSNKYYFAIRLPAIQQRQKNPQANSVCERMHQAIGNALGVLSTLQPPQGIADANQLVLDTAIANAVVASRASLHSSHSKPLLPGGLAFHRDMIMDIPLIADLQTIQEHRQQ
jgi:hypothetical protein